MKEVKYAKRMMVEGGSEISDILALTAKPEVISFAGGLPAPELFPVEDMKRMANEVLDEVGTVALQYSSAQGFPKFRQQIANRMNAKQKTNVAADDILVTSGSQQALEFSGKIFIDEGDVILCESPTYLGALNAFNGYGPKYIEVETDEDGMNMEALERVLQTTDRVKMIYVIPDFQNPTGRTWPLEKRKKFVELITKYKVVALEDNPYGELRYEGEFLPSLKSFDKEGYVVYLGTFSKILCPGYRLGWVCASPEILAKYIRCKEDGDLQTSTISQLEVSRYLDECDVDAHVLEIRALYKKRRDLMLKTIEEEFPEGVKWTHPEGGLFMWVTVPESINTTEMMKKCVDNNVAYVPGVAFYPGRTKTNNFRLNYSNMDEERIVIGIKRIAEVIKNELK